MLKFKDANNFRNLILFSTLSGKNISIEFSEKISDCEKNFLNLICEVTKGTKSYIYEKSTKLDFKPGTIDQDHFERDLTFDCKNTRSIGYYLGPLIILGIFSKDYLELNLSGITNDNFDISVDNFKDSLLPFLQKVYDNQFTFDLKVLKRGFRPSAEGKVHFRVSSIKKILPAVKIEDTNK